jgi:predicted transcriptional regulator
MKSDQIKEKLEEIETAVKDLDDEMQKLSEKKRDLGQKIDNEPPLLIYTIKGKKGGVVAKVRKTGHIVLFKNEPTEEEIGEVFWMNEYELRESERTGNEYYKCFDYGEDKREDIEELEAEKQAIEDDLDKKDDLRWYLLSERDDLKKRYKDAKIKETLSEVGMDTDKLGKIYEMAKIGLTNTLSQFNGSFDRVILGCKEEGWRRDILYLTLVKGDVIVRVSGKKKYQRYLDNPPVDFYTKILYDSDGKGKLKENGRISVKKYKKGEK